jgi:hypothetical protein
MLLARLSAAGRGVAAPRTVPAPHRERYLQTLVLSSGFFMVRGTALASKDTNHTITLRI